MNMISRWESVCALEDIVPDTGVGALLGDRQVAIFRVGDAIHVIGNHDPVSQANVLSRGIVGDLQGQIVVASPIYKQHYSLVSGRCLEDPALSVPVYLSRIEGGRVWVKTTPEKISLGTARRKLVVIGNGMAAMKVIEDLLAVAPQAYEVTVFGAEPHGSYNRVLLSPVLSGEKRSEDIVTHSPEWFAEQGIVFHSGDPIEHIDRARRVVRSRRGIEQVYDRLLVATGSHAIVLPVPGKELPGVVTFRDLADVDSMLFAARTQRRAVVIGGGLLGLEAANGLLKRGMEVSVVHLAGSLMERQLDEPAAALLQGELERRGIQFFLKASTQAILGSERVQGVQLADGREIAADLVVMAVGVRPNADLARAAGLRCDRGVLVDDTLLTYDPAVYAVGECVQHRNSTYGLVAPLWEQAAVCAAHLAERGTARYPGSRLATQLKVSGIDVYSAGEFNVKEGRESLVMRDPKRGVYKRLVLENNRIRGAVLVGDTRDGRWYFDLINEQRDVGAWREQLLFGEAHCT
ncbi:MAG: nitrite reductase small subunit NirD [Steroidobacteraceae bacterium]